MKQKIKRILFWKAIIIIGYFAIGIILNNYIFPEQKPDLANYFKAGDKFQSNSEGLEQTILSEKDGWVHMSSVLKPKAAGPPEHIHTNLVETFTVKEGVLSILVNGEKKQLKAGESITIPVGTAHKPFNETDSPVIIETTENEKTMTVEFAYHLSQIYPFFDNLGENPGVLPIILQFSVYGNEFDAYMVDGPPIVVQKAMRFLLAPTARLLGYKNYYEEYRTKHLE